jgi:hypothetical protein
MADPNHSAAHTEEAETGLLEAIAYIPNRRLIVAAGRLATGPSSSAWSSSSSSGTVAAGPKRTPRGYFSANEQRGRATGAIYECEYPQVSQIFLGIFHPSPTAPSGPYELEERGAPARCVPLRDLAEFKSPRAGTEAAHGDHAEHSTGGTVMNVIAYQAFTSRLLNSSRC